MTEMEIILFAGFVTFTWAIFVPSAVRSRPLRQTGGAQDGRLIGPSYEACDAELKQSILDTLIHLTWPILLRSLHLLFDSLQSSQFKGAAALLPPSLSLPPPSSPLPSPNLSLAHLGSMARAKS